MADVKKPDGSRDLTLSQVERLHVQRALQLYDKSVVRSRGNEIPHSGVYEMRSADLLIIRDVLARVS